MEKNIETFKTSDIKISAFLLSQGISMTGTEKTEPRKFIFCFPGSSRVTKLINDFWTDKALVNPRTLLQSLDRLKDLIHKDYEF